MFYCMPNWLQYEPSSPWQRWKICSYDANIISIFYYGSIQWSLKSRWSLDLQTLNRAVDSNLNKYFIKTHEYTTTTLNIGKKSLAHIHKNIFLWRTEHPTMIWMLIRDRHFLINFLINKTATLLKICWELNFLI